MSAHPSARLDHLDGVASTALLVAALRAAESRRPDALVRDPLAEAVVAIAGDGPATSIWADPDGRPNQIARALHDYVAVRTRFLDDRIEDATADGVRQVVLLGAGLDGRAHRMSLPAGTTIFELDTAEMLATKARVVASAGLEPLVATRAVPADLRDERWPDAVVAAGFDPGAPTMWLAEGLLYYLPRASCDALLAAVSTLAAPGSSLATEYPDGDFQVFFDVVGDDPATRTVGALFEAGPREAPPTWLGGWGWDATATHLADVLGAMGRPVPSWAGMRENPWWLVSARR